MAMKTVLAKTIKKKTYLLPLSQPSLSQAQPLQYTQYLTPGNNHSGPQGQRKYKTVLPTAGRMEQRIFSTLLPQHTSPWVLPYAGKQPVSSSPGNLRQIPTIWREQYEGTGTIKLKTIIQWPYLKWLSAWVVENCISREKKGMGNEAHRLNSHVRQAGS